MNYTLQYENLKNKSKAEIEKELYYLAEENADLRQKVRAGKNAEIILEKNECRLTELMDCYLGLEVQDERN